MRRLPIPEMLGDAFQFVWYEFLTVLRLTWLPLLVVAVAPFLPWIILGVPPTLGGIEPTLQNVLSLAGVSLLVLVAGTMPIAAIQRLVLFGDRNEGRFIPRLPGRLELLYLAAVLAAAVAWLAAGGAVIALGLVNSLLPTIGLPILIVAAYFVALRTLIIFPVAAVERTMDVRLAWRLARGNTWRLFVILVLLFLVLLLPTILLMLLDSIFGRPAIAASVAVSIIISFCNALLANALIGGALAYCYKYLVGIEPETLIDADRLKRADSPASVKDSLKRNHSREEQPLPPQVVALPAVIDTALAHEFLDAPRLPVLATAGAAYAFVWERFGAVFKLLWWPLLALVAVRFFFMPDLLVSSLKLDFTAWFWVVSLALGIFDIVVLCVCVAAMHRWVLREVPSNTPPRLRVGRTELLFLVAAVAIGMLGVMAAGLWGLLGGVVTAVVQVSGSVHAETLQATSWALYALAGLVALLVVLRLALTFPLIIETNRIHFRQSWKLTEGNLWRAIGLTLIVSVPGVIGFVASEILIAPLLHVPLGELQSAARRVSTALSGVSYVVLLVEVAVGSAAVSIAYKALLAQTSPYATQLEASS